MQKPRNHEEDRLEEEDRLDRVAYVASFLSVSRSKVYQLMDAGLLPYVKLGRSRRIPHAAVLKLVQDHLVSRGERS